MKELFPSAPAFLERGTAERPAYQWVMPTIRRRSYFGTFKILPSGIPDCLYIDIVHTNGGIERCTAAIYGGNAYLIHYEFKTLNESTTG